MAQNQKQIVCLESLENLEESGFNQDKITSKPCTHKSFEYEKFKMEIDSLSKDRGGRFVLDSPLSY
jgi:hypothetical protein